MDSDELARLLGELPRTRVSVEAGVLVVGVPGIGDTVRLELTDVVGYEQVSVPTGAPGVELGVRRRHEQLPLIVTVDDVVFMASYAADIVAKGAEVKIPAVPHLVAYSEMHRDVRALGRAIDKEGAEFDPDMLAATLLVHRCFIAGAVRVGLWPVRVAAWWEYTWARVGKQLEVGPFRADPVWDRLMDDVTKARKQSAALVPVTE